MKKFMERWLLFTILMFSLIACGKNTEQQISEQLELGQKYLTEGNYEQAIVAFNKAIEIEPKAWDAYIGIANAYGKQGNNGKAINIMTQALAVADGLPGGELSEEDSQSINEMKSLAAGLYEQGLVAALDNCEDGEEYYQSLLELTPERAEKYEDEMKNSVLKRKLWGEYGDDLIALADILNDGDNRELSDLCEILNEQSFVEEILAELEEDSEFNFKMENGKYIQIWGNGIYYGNLKDGKRHDNCGYYIRSGMNRIVYLVFRGIWENGMPNGKGELSDYHSDTYRQYRTGEWKNGLENGTMTLIYEKDDYGKVTFMYNALEGVPEIIEEGYNNTFEAYCFLYAKAISFEKYDSAFKGYMYYEADSEIRKLGVPKWGSTDVGLGKHIVVTDLTFTEYNSQG